MLMRDSFSSGGRRAGEGLEKGFGEGMKRAGEFGPAKT